MPKPRRNLAQSVHHRLLNRARQQGEDFNLILIHYAMERFLYRLGRSQYKDRFILKGAMLFPVVVQNLRALLLEPLHAAARSQPLAKSWKPGGSWV